MKFRVTTEHVYPWPVVINPPDPDNAGAVLEQKFNMTFRAMTRSEAEALDKEIAALPESEQSARVDDVLRQVCKGWDDSVVDEKDKPIAFSAEVLEAILQHSWNRLGLYRAYRQSLQGRAAELGN